MRVAIVNDMKLAVEALKRALQAAPGVDVAWIAENGLLALEACRRDTPDVVLMDLLMPVMDGVESTRRILAECATTVIVVTSTVDGNASRVFQAMGCGALDAVPTPTLGPSGRVLGAEPLLESLLRVAKLASPRTALP
ncbi:MAG TPA: chemotaxis response regulator protein-glutamate methylesterase, partial [Verrucomicrobia bacterium]|nr:chemotaxis response regulator protein-glutamate methylesterase [Verrucomicrobiota bacterium]